MEVDKHKEFLKKVWEGNEAFRNKEFDIISTFKFWTKLITVRDKYGEYRINPHSLIRGVKPSMIVSTDKLMHLKRKIADKYPNLLFRNIRKHHSYHKYYLDVFCEKHGWYNARVDHLLSGVGCANCNKIMFYDFTNLKGLKEKVKKLTFYVIEMFDEQEVFYKVGLSKNLERRLKEFKKYYNVKLSFKEDISIEEAIKWEVYFKDNYKVHRYTPKKLFKGHSECFEFNPLESEYYKENKNIHNE